MKKKSKKQNKWERFHENPEYIQIKIYALRKGTINIA